MCVCVCGWAGGGGGGLTVLGVDAVGIDQQPQINHNPAASIFFIVFLLVVGYFVLNMFVGVIVENFQRTMPPSEVGAHV